MDHQPSTKC